MLSTQREATIAHLDQIGAYIEVAVAWESSFDTRRMCYELAHFAQIIGRCHNTLAAPGDHISFDDPEALWIVEIMSALREFRPSTLSQE